MAEYGDVYQARVTLGYKPADQSPEHNLGLDIQIKVYDKQGRFVEGPEFAWDDNPYEVIERLGLQHGFLPGDSRPEAVRNSGYTMRQDPVGYLWSLGTAKAKMYADKLVKDMYKRPNVHHMQDVRKQIWKAAHGSYWRHRYAYRHPIKPKR